MTCFSYGRGQSTKYTSDAYYTSTSYCCPRYYGYAPNDCKGEYM